MSTQDAQKPVTKTAVVRLLLVTARFMFTINCSDGGRCLLSRGSLVGESLFTVRSLRSLMI